MSAAMTMLDAHLQRNPVAGSAVSGSPVAPRRSRAQRRARQKIVAQASSSRLNAVAAPTLNGVTPLQNGAKPLEEWSPESWKHLEAKQQPTYPDQVTYMIAMPSQCVPFVPPAPLSPVFTVCREIMGWPYLSTSKRAGDLPASCEHCEAHAAARVRRRVPHAAGAPCAVRSRQGLHAAGLLTAFSLAHRAVSLHLGNATAASGYARLSLASDHLPRLLPPMPAITPVRGHPFR